MSEDYFDQLEAELRMAVPRAVTRRRLPNRSGGAVVAFAVAVTVVVAVLAVGLLGHRRQPSPAPAATAPVNPTAPLVAGSRVEYILAGNGLVGVRFGLPRRTVAERLSAVIGPPTRAWVRGGTCGLDHTVAWGGPRLTAPLTLYFRRRRFAGYQYGLQSGDAKHLRLAHGTRLATAQGLTIGDTLAAAKRIYGGALRRSAAQGGSWKARTVGGEVAGFEVLNPRNGRVLSDTNLVATIDAGDVGCAALSP